MARAPAVHDAEPAPEADRLAEFPHPRETQVLFGHATAERALAEMVRAGRVHHGWLLTGPEGIGKATLSYRFARYLLARPHERPKDSNTLDIAADTAAARQVIALSHPGLLVLRRQWDPKAKRFGTAIAVDDVRRLRNFLAHAADAESWRVVIVDPADDLNISAANAVLKSLEEPPARTVFLLISSEPGRLLPTIRSRCRTLALAPLGEVDLRSAVDHGLAAAGRPAVPQTEWSRIAELARGSIRRALELSEPDGLAIHDKVAGILGLLPKVDWPAAHALSDELAATSAEQRFEGFYGTMLDTLAGYIRVRATGEGDPKLVARATTLIPEGRLSEFAETWQRIVTQKAETDRLNLDRKALVLNTLALLAASARRD